MEACEQNQATTFGPESHQFGGRTFITKEDDQTPWNAVCRISIGGHPHGSGFLIGDHLLMTNDHVLSTVSACNQATAEFFLTGNSPVAVSFDPNSYFIHSPQTEGGKATASNLDYTIVALQRDLSLDWSPTTPFKLSLWGEKEIESLPGSVNIIQHPGGHKCKYKTTGQIKNSDDYSVRYGAETEPGSSGSPVWMVSNSEVKVYALHYYGGKPGAGNRGILVNAIVRDLKKKGRYEEVRDWIAPHRQTAAQLYQQALSHVSHSIGKAAPLFVMAANRGEIQAYRRVGTCFLKGNGLDKNEEQARLWFGKSARTGDREAQFQYGQMCEKGIGSKKNITLGIYWYRRAANQQQPDAKKRLDEWQDVQRKLCAHAERARTVGLGAAKIGGGGAVGSLLLLGLAFTPVGIVIVPEVVAAGFFGGMALGVGGAATSISSAGAMAGLNAYADRMHRVWEQSYQIQEAVTEFDSDNLDGLSLESLKAWVSAGLKNS